MRKPFPLIPRFWGKVDKSAGNYECWLWTGRHDPKGYGYFDFSARSPRPAHRVAYLLAYGDFPQNLAVCHHCDNPSCVNPKHLFLGTLAENNRDMREKGRGKNPPRIIRRGANSPMAKLTEENARLIKKSTIPLKDAALMFGVSPGLISMIRNGRRWSHLDGA